MSFGPDDARTETDDSRLRGWLREALRWALQPRPRAPEVSEILEAHRMAWIRIEMRRQEFAPPDLAVAQRIKDGYGLTSKTYYGYERSAQRPAVRPAPEPVRVPSPKPAGDRPRAVAGSGSHETRFFRPWDGPRSPSATP